MRKQIYVIALFAILILYFTGCQKPQGETERSQEDNHPESTPMEVTGRPGSKLYQLCPAGKVKEDSTAVESDLYIFRSRVTLPGACGLKLQNSVFRFDDDDFQNAAVRVSQNSFLLSYRIQMDNAPVQDCLPQYSVWLKTQEGVNENTYTEGYERLDIGKQEPNEVLSLMGYPKPFPGHLVGLRKAVCE